MSKLSIILLLWLVSSALRAEILVIVNASNPVPVLARKQVVDLFMGRVSAFPDGGTAHTLDLKAGIPQRAQFYKILTGKSEAQVDAYWATLIFAGRMAPPEQFPSAQAIISEVARNPAAIAYVARQQLPKTVKVVMELSSAQ